MSVKDQTNFMKLAAKGWKAMAKAITFDAQLKKLALDAAKFARKGYLTFQNWFQKLPYEDKLALAGELAFFTRQKDKTIEKMLKFKFEEEELKDFKDIIEDMDKGATSFL